MKSLKSVSRRVVAVVLLVGSVVGISPVYAADHSTTPAQEQQVVDINHADADTLAKELNGIGPAKAKAIVEYRNQHGAFKTVEQLSDVSGIGEATIEKNKSKLVVK